MYIDVSPRIPRLTTASIKSRNTKKKKSNFKFVKSPPTQKNKHINMSDTTTNNASVNVNKDVKKVNDEVRRVFPISFS